MLGEGKFAFNLRVQNCLAIYVAKYENLSDFKELDLRAFVV